MNFRIEHKEHTLQKIIDELILGQNVRSNLSELRKSLKDQRNRIEEDKIAKVVDIVATNESIFLGFLQNEDAKTRKNAAALLGDLQYKEAENALYEAYTKETTLFVRSVYLDALAEVCKNGMKPEILAALKTQLENRLQEEPAPENKKHVEEEIRSIRRIIIQREGISRHSAVIADRQVSVLLLTNKSQRETIRRTITWGQAAIHPLGILVQTDRLQELMNLRTYREMVFPIQTAQPFLPADPLLCAKAIMESDMEDILKRLHEEDTPYYFRIEVKSPMELEDRSAFTRKMATELERLSKGGFINSTSDYEVEIRLIANKDGEFFPCMKLLTLSNPRFAYRKNAIASSIHPSTAALIMEIAAPYLKEEAQIMDPFCGVGTMLIERHKRVPAREIYGTDIFGDAIVYARENTELANMQIHFIHRDFMDFKHDYLFDEIITNMPLRGKKTKQEMDAFYQAFLEKAKTILRRDGVIVMYTNEVGFVKKQLRLQKEYTLLQENLLQAKNDFYLLILGYKG